MKHSFLLPAHFKPAIELALKEIATDGFIYDGVVMGEFTEQHNFIFEVEADYKDLFRLAFKSGFQLATIGKIPEGLTRKTSTSFYIVRKGVSGFIPNDGYSLYWDRMKKADAGELQENEQAYGYAQALEHITELKAKPNYKDSAFEVIEVTAITKLITTVG
jgi:hypothetical protein